MKKSLLFTMLVFINFSLFSEATITIQGSLNAFASTAGNPSAVQSFTVSGSNLTGNITVTAPANFEIALTNNNAFFCGLLPVTQAWGWANAVVYVRYKPTTAGNHSGNITLTSSGATSQDVPLSGSTSTPSSPTISTQGSLTAFTATVGIPSAVQNFTVSGSDLTSNITVTAPANFEIAFTNSDASFCGLLPVTQSGGTASAIVYVRYKPGAAGSHSGNITLTSTGAISQDILVSGNASSVSSPAITVQGSLTAFATTVGNPSAVQTFTVSGSDLTSNITVTAPANFEIAFTNNNASFCGLLPVTQSGGAANAIIYVRYKPTAAGSHNGNITLNSTGASAQNIPVSGNASLVSSPLITIQGSLTAFSSTVNNPSAVQTFTVSGNNLTGNITIMSPTNFEIAFTNNNTSFCGLLPVTQSGGAAHNIVVYVRYKPTATGSHNGNITLTSTGATAQNIAVTGTAITPSAPAIHIEGTINTFTTTAGNPSAAQSLMVSGGNLTEDITITAPADFEIALTNNNSLFCGKIPLGTVGDTVYTKIVYIRYKPASAGSHAGNITFTSAGAPEQSVSLTGISQSTGINETINEALITVYPNPAKDNIHIELKTSAAYILNITDISGSTVYTEAISNASGTNISPANLKQGIYFIRIQTSEGGYATQKLIVE